MILTLDIEFSKYLAYNVGMKRTDKAMHM